jgi:DNA repair protein RadA/Sms
VTSVPIFQGHTDIIATGEIGLGGEIRSVSQIDKRISEAEKLGFKRFILPNAKVAKSTIKCIAVKNIQDVRESIF